MIYYSKTHAGRRPRRGLRTVHLLMIVSGVAVLVVDLAFALSL